MTALSDDDFTTARGFVRNGQGRPLVTHPDTGKLVPYWGASEWPMDGPYTGDPIHGERGTLVHDLVYFTLGAIPADGLKARREELGIPAEVARHIADDWQRFSNEHNIVVDHVEHPSVNDRYEIASPIDIVGTVGGQPAVIDIKTASDHRKVAYAVQMVYYVGSVRYVDGDRTEWFDEYDRELAAFLAHYPIGKALKAHAAGEPLPRWELHPVDVEAARPWADMLHTLRRARPAVAFPGRADTVGNAGPEEVTPPAGSTVDKIAVPDERTANVSTVEPPAEGEHPAPSATLAEFFDSLPDEGGTIDPVDAADAVRTHRDGEPLENSKGYEPDLLTQTKMQSVAAQQPIKTKVVGVTFADAYPAICSELRPGMVGELKRDPNNKHDENAIGVSFLGRHVGHIARDVAAVMAPQMDAGTSWSVSVLDVLVTPGAEHQPGIAINCYPGPYELDRFGRPILPPADEGDQADPAAVAVLKARYAALEGDGRLWVNAVAKHAQAAGGSLSLAESQPQTIRRFEAMRGLVLLAEGGFADDDATRGILRPIIGDVADMRDFTVGKLVAHLTPAEAAVFARLADTVANGTVALAVQADGRFEWEFAT